MKPYRRRAFLSDITRGMIITGLGPGVASQLGINSAFAEEGSDSLDFGKLQPLVGLMQEKPGKKLQPILVDKLKRGETDLRSLIAAASLANAETFGGQDYVGYHTEMALVPALNMSNLMTEELQPLPVLKVLYRNADRIQGVGGATKKTLRKLHGTDAANGLSGEALRKATRAGKMKAAEDLFATMSKSSLEDAYNNLQFIVQDDMNVHRFVLGYRVWELIDIVGKEQAHTILRQSVRFCVNEEQRRLKDSRPESPIRALVPKLLDQHKLVGRSPGTTRPDDAMVEELSRVIYNEGKIRATDAVAAAIADGIHPEDIGEAISLASNQLVLRQTEGRAHGASRGVHGSDAVNAWRNMIRITNDRNTIVGLLVAAYHTADYSAAPVVQGEPFPHTEHREKISTKDSAKLLRIAEEAIRDNDQVLAAAAIDRYGAEGQAEKPVFDLMLKYAVSEDGRLHAEKYYQTVVEEFVTTRPAFRWRQLTAMARVTASAYGYTVNDEPGFRAPGYEEALKLLKA